MFITLHKLPHNMQKHISLTFPILIEISLITFKLPTFPRFQVSSHRVIIPMQASSTHST